MSMVAHLHEEDMTCWCPFCGEIVEVDEYDPTIRITSGIREYHVQCPECGQFFYVSGDY